jgi:hypothetical protein
MYEEHTRLACVLSNLVHQPSSNQDKQKEQGVQGQEYKSCAGNT